MMKTSEQQMVTSTSKRFMIRAFKTFRRELNRDWTPEGLWEELSHPMMVAKALLEESSKVTTALWL